MLFIKRWLSSNRLSISSVRHRFIIMVCVRFVCFNALFYYSSLFLLYALLYSIIYYIEKKHL